MILSAEVLGPFALPPFPLSLYWLFISPFALLAFSTQHSVVVLFCLLFVSASHRDASLRLSTRMKAVVAAAAANGLVVAAAAAAAGTSKGVEGVF